MFTSLVPRIAGDDEPPDASRHRLAGGAWAQSWPWPPHWPWASR